MSSILTDEVIWKVYNDVYEADNIDMERPEDDDVQWKAMRAIAEKQREQSDYQERAGGYDE